MNKDTWARINDLFHQALQRPADDRATFLDAACAGDDRLRREVESLLAAHEQAEDFIERPSVSAAAMVRSGVVPELPPDQIGPYRVLRLLGEGGMGVVYLAEDTRLGRTVALKALAPRYVGDSTSRERLRREARAAASLNHPGIATVYALEEIDEHLYIAGEYVPGETLRDELFRAPFDPSRAIETTIQIARALALAHQRGIVHRDLKPENVIRTPSGDIKILDFGLARFRDARHPEVVLSADGSILGTPAYMSPEQIRGSDVDARSDLFSLGIMLYEFLTGVHPFMGSDPASTIARVLEAEPPRLVDHLPGGVPASVLGSLEHVVLSCLRKSPDSRFASATDLVAALERAQDVLTASASGASWARTTHHRQPTPGETIAARRSTPQPFAPETAEMSLAHWWWRFHQGATVIVYSLLLLPLWIGREGVTPPNGTLIFLTGLIGVILASALRLHLWFAARIDPSGWREHNRVSGRWRRLGDVLLVLALVVEGLVVIVRPSSAADGDGSWVGIVLIAAAVAVLVSFAIIEPTTAQTAFGAQQNERRAGL